jgi:DNA invertase Pin-like site-specific DNA recombinase
MLTGPLAGVYDPNGMGSMLFAVLAVAAQLEREYIREKTLEGQATAADAGRFAGRPRAIDEDMLTFAVALRAKGKSVPEIAATIIMSSGKNAGKHPSTASVYRALAEHDAAQADAQLLDAEALVPSQARPLESVAG